jgi:hypothetical protein
LDVFSHLLVEQRPEVFTLHYLGSLLLTIMACQYIIMAYLHDFCSDSLIRQHIGATLVSQEAIYIYGPLRVSLSPLQLLLDLLGIPIIFLEVN